MRKTLATLALASTLVFIGSCKKKITEESTTIQGTEESTTIQGTVFSERYMPGSAGASSIIMESRYSFSLDTEKGRKAFEVSDEGILPKKESIDAMIEPGTRVEVQIRKGSENKTFYRSRTYRIRVID